MEVSVVPRGVGEVTKLDGMGLRRKGDVRDSAERERTTKKREEEEGGKCQREIYCWHDG